MKCLRTLECDSDTGFRREIDDIGNTDGRAQRGANYMRAGRDESGQSIVHLLDWTCGSVKQDVRSTFTSETHGVIMTVDRSIVLATALHEVIHGPVTQREAMRMTEEAGLTSEPPLGALRAANQTAR